MGDKRSIQMHNRGQGDNRGQGEYSMLGTDWKLNEYTNHQQLILSLVLLIAIPRMAVHC